jgi:hypothetical protein
MPFHDFESQVETSDTGVISMIKKHKNLKSPDEVLEAVLNIYHPIQMLSRIQENFEELEEEVQVFDYSDLNHIENSEHLSSSLSQSSNSHNPYAQTHNKMIVDVFNEAILRSAKKKVSLPWKIKDQIFCLEYENLMKSSTKKILKWCGLEAGKIPSVEMINSFGELDEDKLQQVRQEKLAEFLIVDVAEGDNMWVECDFEESQVAIDVADWIMADLYEETAELI